MLHVCVPHESVIHQDLNVMFMGGLMVAVVIEHSGLHRRIALSILRLVGTNPRLLMLGKVL